MTSDPAKAAKADEETGEELLQTMRRSWPETGPASAEAPPATGRARYAEERLLGEGGMGRVHEAVDQQFGRKVALKELRAANASPEQRTRFVTEALITANLEHPAIPAVYERGATESGPFYTMRLVEGRNLEQAIAEAASLPARLKLVPVVLRAAQAIAFAHQRGILHRDLKPQNIVVGRYGEVAVIDWGLAKPRAIPFTPAPAGSGASDPMQTREGAVIGTPAYMAPEQARGHIAEIDERTDVFALGAMLYQVLAGRAPYSAADTASMLAQAASGTIEPLARLVPECPNALRRLVLKAMASDPAARHRDASEFARELESILTDALTDEGSRSVRWFARLAAAMGLGLVVLASVATWQLAPSLRAMGPAVLAGIILAAAGSVFSAIEWATRGRYSLGSLAAAFMIATVLMGLLGTFNGMGAMLEVAREPEFLSDARQWRELITVGMREALGNIPMACSLALPQVMLWGIARRRTEQARARSGRAAE